MDITPQTHSQLEAQASAAACMPPRARARAADALA
jgi:hypothetical protein